MATGTGKTYTAFQIIWRLWKAGRKKRILFLADRNVLVDQTMVNDFRPFGAAMAKLSTQAKTIERDDGDVVYQATAIDKKRRIDPAAPADKPRGGRKKIYVDGVAASIIAERVEYLDENGKLFTESLRDFTKRALRKRFTSLDDFLKRWKSAERKQAIVEELEAEGLALDAIADELGKDLDPFDLICHIAFDAKPLTRRERAENVTKRDVFTQYGPQARTVLEALLAKYADEGVFNLDDANVLKIAPFSQMGSVMQLINQVQPAHHRAPAELRVPTLRVDRDEPAFL